MALATRCPACGTTFRVVSDQLKLQNGLVKCGHCGVVFDGIEHMRYLNSITSSGSTSVHPVVAEQGEDTAPHDHNRQDAPEKLDDSKSAPQSPTEIESYVLPSFMLPDKKYSVAFRLLWGFFVLTAGLGLLLQITYWYRHEIVAFSDPRMPEIRTLILRSCQALPLEIDCTIKLPRHIERLKVSAAEVIETNTPGLYSLRLSLRNESQLPQAYPALDMTLSDARNSIVTRKILLPEQYLANIQGSNVGTARLILQGLAGQDEQSFILPIKIESEVNESVPGRVAGYLVEIFYP